ncbi:unnamed protein product [Cylindrotheca closterium]|uniref:DUF4116 domain-containing protein n=1 Tax=Cylindrotheca closterium TaxID=2856 RepID=A0AAD2PVF4_9STRA|nr:unnamed protein product [Cylindrotheca closterium]
MNGAPMIVFPMSEDDASTSTSRASSSVSAASESSDSSLKQKYSQSNDCSSTATSAISRKRQSMMLISKDARAHWKSLPSEWQLEKEFVLVALRQSPTLPEKADFERQLPQRLRFDKDIVLAFCHRPDFLQLYDERHLFVPGCWTHDREIMLAYCQKIPRSLQECSEDLCDSEEIVHAAVKVAGMELQYASMRLQEDKETIKLACKSHGGALGFCPPGPTRSELVQDRHFMLHTVLANPGGGAMWKLLPNSMEEDAELLLMALRHGLHFRDIPKALMNLEFLTMAIRANSKLYLELTKPWREQECLSREALISEASDAEIHAKALEECPQLRRNRVVILQIARNGSRDLLHEIVSANDFQYQDDLEVMKIAIQQNSKFFDYASARLQQMPEIILVSITPHTAWNTIKNVSWTIQRMHPEIPVRAVELSVARNLRYMPSHIPEDLWSSSRDLGIAWIRRGGQIIDAIEQQLRRDKPMGLEVAKHNWAEFYKVGKVLLKDRKFMLQALKEDGRVIRFADEELIQDMDILMSAVAYHPIPSTLSTTFHGIYNLDELKRHVETKLQLHSTFLLDFLRGIAISPQPNMAPNLRSQLPMLDRGVETSEAFKRLICDYLGVPIGQQLRLLRQAFANMKRQNQDGPVVSVAANDEPIIRPAMNNDRLLLRHDRLMIEQRELRHRRRLQEFHRLQEFRDDYQIQRDRRLVHLRRLHFPRVMAMAAYERDRSREREHHVGGRGRRDNNNDVEAAAVHPLPDELDFGSDDDSVILDLQREDGSDSDF